MPKCCKGWKSMKFKLNYLKIALCLGSSVALSISHAGTLQTLTDEQLSESTGQALMSLSYLAPTDSTNPMKNIVTDGKSNTVGFYKLGLEAELELNTNIRNLQLGCGGVNGANACDIDIKNLALSGLPDSYDADGNPVFNNGRTSKSAEITNPFMEFAISNPNSASTREIKGIRFSAEKINALLTAGLENNATVSQTDGIQRLSGFMQIAGTSGVAKTKEAVFGVPYSNDPAIVNDQQLTGYADLCVGIFGNDCGLADTHIRFQSQPKGEGTTGVKVPSVSTTFTINPFVINGNRQTEAVVKGIRTALAEIPIAAPVTGATQAEIDYFKNDQLRVNLSCNNMPSGAKTYGCGLVTAFKDNALFKMGAGSKIKNLNLNIDFYQSLSMFHNIPLTGTGGYLSLQSASLLWPGAIVSDTDKNITDLSGMSANTDVAQKGWWMSFKDPVQLGKLNVSQEVVLDNATLKQVAERVTAQLSVIDANTPKARAPGLGDLFKLLADNPLSSVVVADLDQSTKANPVYMRLENQQLINQKVISNCYGTLKFC